MLGGGERGAKFEIYFKNMVEYFIYEDKNLDMLCSLFALFNFESHIFSLNLSQFRLT